MSKKIYIALIGDLINSKKIPSRREMQETMEEVFAGINRDFEDYFASKLTLTIGDEFQCLLKPTANVPLLIDTLEKRLGLDFRIGLGAGTIATKINPELSLGADGEAYWRAREAIEYVHDKNWNGKCHIYFIGPSEETNEIVNTLFACSETFKHGWTKLQEETFHALLDQGIYEADFYQKDLAESMNISESSLTKRLNSGNIKIYLQARVTVGKLLEATHV